MARTTRAQLDSVLLRLEATLGTSRKLELDNQNPGDGRTYRVMDSRGVDVLGHRRRKAREMLETMYAVIMALEYREAQTKD